MQLHSHALCHTPTLLAADHDPLDAVAGRVLEQLRLRRPRVHALTSPVALARTADVLLALGCEPSLTCDPDEVAALAGSADALLVNLGMLDGARRRAAPLAMAAAAGRPIVLDPVFVERDPARLALALELAPAASWVKTNARETASFGAADPAELARLLRRPVAVTGAVDIVSDGREVLRVAGGHPYLARLTASGCAAGAVMAAALAVEPNGTLAVAGALAILGAAAEFAGARAGGPGTFAPLWIDALASLTPAALAGRRAITEG